MLLRRMLLAVVVLLVALGVTTSGDGRRPTPRARRSRPRAVSSGNGRSSCRAPASTSRRSATSSPSTSFGGTASVVHQRHAIDRRRQVEGHARRDGAVQDPHRRVPAHRTRRNSTAPSWSSGTTSAVGSTPAPNWRWTAHDELIREGMVWVGVTAQKVGIEGGSNPLVVRNLDLKHRDPERYGTLVHPGDSYSYDMYSPGRAQAVRSDATQLLGGLRPKQVDRGRRVAVGLPPHDATSMPSNRSAKVSTTATSSTAAAAAAPHSPRHPNPI